MRKKGIFTFPILPLGALLSYSWLCLSFLVFCKNVQRARQVFFSTTSCGQGQAIILIPPLSNNHECPARLQWGMRKEMSRAAKRY